MALIIAPGGACVMRSSSEVEGSWAGFAPGIQPTQTNPQAPLVAGEQQQQTAAAKKDGCRLSL
jgi:hypothetical protein